MLVANPRLSASATPSSDHLCARERYLGLLRDFDALWCLPPSPVRQLQMDAMIVLIDGHESVNAGGATSP
jgi:hypothetical protein